MNKDERLTGFLKLRQYQLNTFQAYINCVKT